MLKYFRSIGQIVYPQEGPKEEYLGMTRRALRTPDTYHGYKKCLYHSNYYTIVFGHSDLWSAQKRSEILFFWAFLWINYLSY